MIKKKEVSKKVVPFSSVKIGAYDVPITETEDYIQFGNCEALGLYEPDKIRISLSAKIEGQRLTHVVCHEICHAMANLHHIPTPDDVESMELTNDMLATALYAFIRDNPEVIKWIQKNK